MRVSKFNIVYPEPGKTHPTVKHSRKKPGVYILADNSGQLRYIGMSRSSLYHALTRHFQSWDDKRQKRVVYDQSAGMTCRIVLTNSPEQAVSLERALIIKHRPVDNPDKLELYLESDLNEGEVLAHSEFLEQTDKAPF